MKPTADSIEAEAALVRSQLVAVGADIRHHADPAVIVDAAKDAFKRRAEGAPSFLKENATPIGMIMLGGAFGAVLTGLFSPQRRSSVASTPVKVAKAASSGDGAAQPVVRSQVNAALLSTVGVGLGYFAGMFVPTTATEDRLLGEPKAVLAQHLDDFLKEHTQGMKMAAANAFGLSRLSATTLIGIAMLAEALGVRRQRSEPGSL